MKVAFDVQHLLSHNKTGIAYYTEQIIKALLQKKQNMHKDINSIENIENVDYILNFFSIRNTANKVAHFMQTYVASSIKPCSYFSYTVYKMLYSFLPVPYSLFHSENANIYHFFNFVVPPFVNGKVVLTVHDLVFKDFPETVNNKTKFFLQRNFAKSLKRADAIVVISEFTKSRLLHHYNISDKIIEVIPCGVDFEMFNSSPIIESNDLNFPINPSILENVKKKYGIGHEYFLYIGTLEPRKNIERLINAYVNFAKERINPPQLVLGGGKGWLDKSIYDALQKSQKTENAQIIQTGYLNRDEIPVLMRGAIAFCFPSIYEGFGMPVLEAMACGVAVLTSNAASMPEVVADTGLLVDPFDTNSITQGLSKLYDDNDYRLNLALKGYIRSKKFSWEVAASKLLKLYNTISASKP